MALPKVAQAAARSFSSMRHPPDAAFSYVNGASKKPLIGMTLGQAFDHTCAKHGKDRAIVSRQQKIRWDYDEFSVHVNKLAAALLKLGLNKGDRVALWAPNCAEWVTAQFATAKAGLIMVSINPAYKVTEIAYALNKVKCAAIIASSSFRSSNFDAMLREVAPELNTSSAGSLHAKAVPSLRHVICLADAHHKGMHRYQDVLQYATETDIAAMQNHSAKLSFDDAINIQFTSGTTGSPKATMLTHHNILNNAVIVGDNINLTPKDMLVANPPFFHCMGMVMTTLNAMQRGASVLLPSLGFDAEAALAGMAEEQATAILGVPTMFIQMLNHPSMKVLKPKLQSLRTGIMAGSVCPIELMRRVESELGIKELAICYGMTETSPVSTQTNHHDPEWARTETVGKVAPHTELKVIDPETGLVVRRGEKGELCTRGYLVMQGYWEEPQKTAESVKNGWMHTGDLAQIDDHGYVRIVGRIKDMIIRGGENVFPREVEDYLYTFPHLMDVSVYGVTDEVMGEEIAANIILKAGSPPVTVEDIKAFCKGKIAHYKVPKHVRFVDSFPQTGSGKIQKFVMKAELEGELAAKRKHHH